nr:hypothetical protein [uncultured Roseococcus sp.]
MARTLTARFDTRREAELAIEHLVQKHGVKREGVSAHPVGARNTVGTRIAGSDAPDAQVGTRERDDAALHGAVEVSVELSAAGGDALRKALTEVGARDLAEA